jgi:hypothetical protein
MDTMPILIAASSEDLLRAAAAGARGALIEIAIEVDPAAMRGNYVTVPASLFADTEALVAVRDVLATIEDSLRPVAPEDRFNLLYFGTPEGTDTGRGRSAAA